MKPKVFLVITSIIAFALGVIFILGRNFAMGISNAMGSGLIAQILGANFIGFATLNLFGRNLEGEGLRVILLANFISNILGLLLTVATGLTSGLNVIGWIVAAVYLVYTLLFGFYLFYRPRLTMEQVPCPAEPC
jgi:preprotein translocase subunit SecG